MDSMTGKNGLLASHVHHGEVWVEKCVGRGTVFGRREKRKNWWVGFPAIFLREEPAGRRRERGTKPACCTVGSNAYGPHAVDWIDGAIGEPWISEGGNFILHELFHPLTFASLSLARRES